jgi:hypothetical protein
MRHDHRFDHPVFVGAASSRDGRIGIPRPPISRLEAAPTVLPSIAVLSGAAETMIKAPKKNKTLVNADSRRLLLVWHFHVPSMSRRRESECIAKISAPSSFPG